MLDEPRYSLPEIERRWLVDDDRLPDLSRCERVRILDRYLVGTRMRLRKAVSDRGTTFKLCKKYGKTRPITESITNLYLDRGEYETFASLPANVVVRDRYRIDFEGHVVSINVPVEGTHPTVAECEFLTLEEARRFEPPVFCTREVSDDPAFEAVRFADHREGQTLG